MSPFISVPLAYVAIGLVLYAIYFVWSRKTREHELARHFEDEVAVLLCIFWPIGIVVVIWWIRNTKG